MSKYTLTEINIYPVKSLGGISLQKSEVTDRGLKYDRRWLIIDSEEKFITQRTHPQLALFKTKISGNKLILGHKTKEISPLVIPTYHESTDIVFVTIWDDLVEAHLVGKYADEWLSEALEIKCRLVHMPEETQRFVDRAIATDNEIVSFADAYPFMMIGQSSLDDLNNKLEEKLPANRFRPNFVFAGGDSFDEDKWKKIRIGEVIFNFVKPCSRCTLTTVDQGTAEKSDEPLKTLSSYRSFNNKIYFGQNLLHEGKGMLKIGDEIEVLEWK